MFIKGALKLYKNLKLANFTVRGRMCGGIDA